ncbi:MAG: SDR family oxidoreductase [Candidatus Schekmanbacteria bacterium]|nr:SDR family oxidoreductase [Candidatus Schekmanbacteria bacterium]
MAEESTKGAPRHGAEGGNAGGTTRRLRSPRKTAETPKGAANGLERGGIFLTGVPGFIGKRLARQLLDVHAGHPAFFLVEPRMMAQAEKWIEEIRGDSPERAAQVRLLAGDITASNCGLEGAALEEVLTQTRHMFHLAAIYDLTVGRSIAVKVNVEGTRNVLDLAAQMPNLLRLNYISTCFVAGDRKGVVMESELDEGQLFKNFYEETKFLAEVEVRRRFAEIPIVVYRPAIVVGDSRTGETDKFDGPYYAFRASYMGLLVVRPGACKAPVNIVPVDFIVDAIRALSIKDGLDGMTFQLVDPATPRATEVIDMIAERIGSPSPKLRVPAFLFTGALRSEKISAMLGIPRQVLDYFNHGVVFDTQNTQWALEGTGVSCPPFGSYINNLLAFYRQKALATLPWRIA